MSFFTQSSIQEVIDRLDAVAVVSDYVRLEKRGGRFWACCPFHQEKTGSFTVNPELKTYYCFGCHKGGTIINFVMEMDKTSFPETIELLAKRFAVELVYENSGGKGFSADEEARKKARDGLFELYRRISGTFHHFLLKKPEAEAVKLYIIKRGFGIEMIKRFGLGYSPADRYWLYNFLSRKGYSEEFLASSGLFFARNPRVSLFSGRLMFPIADRQGRIAAFGGRVVPAASPANLPRESGVREPPKYINSPELGIYKKGETLYAADLALPEIRRTKTAYVAEGYMDVIALHQAGITNAVAPLGTAFTDEQAKLLKRWAEKAVFFFDSDGAGEAAALKAIYTCRKNGLPCAIVAPRDAAGGVVSVNAAPSGTGLADANFADAAASSLPAANLPKDPADILRYSGAEALQKRAKSVINDFDYLLFRAGSLYDASGQGKAQAVAFIFPYIDLLDSEVARESCIEAVADRFGLLPAAVAGDYRRYAEGHTSAEKFPAGRTPAGTTSGGGNPRREEFSVSPEGKAERPVRLTPELSPFIAAAVDYIAPGTEKIFTRFRAALEISEIEDQNAKEICIALEECIRYGETSADEFLARISSPELKKLFIQCVASGEFSVNTGKLVADGINRIKEKRLERRQNDIIIKLRTLKKSITEEERNTEEKELLAEKMRIDDELHKMRQGR